MGKPPDTVPRSVLGLDFTDILKVRKFDSSRIGLAFYVDHFNRPVFFRYLAIAALKRHDNITSHGLKSIIFKHLHPFLIKTIIQVIGEFLETVTDGTKSVCMLPCLEPCHFGAARLKTVNIGKIEQVLVLLRIIEKIHDGETEIIRIRATYSINIKNTADNENSTEIAIPNRAAQLIKDEGTVSREVRRKCVCFCEDCFEKEILHGKRNRPRGIRKRLNHQIEIGCLPEREKITPGGADQLGGHQELV